MTKKKGKPIDPNSKRQQHLRRRQAWFEEYGTGLPRGSRGLRPHTWTTGPDPLTHEMYHPWQVHKAQCKYRNEEFNLTFEEFQEIWRDDWSNRGRKSTNVCMTRIDYEGAWEWGNVEIITRREHVKRQRQLQLMGRGRTGKNPWRFIPKPAQDNEQK